MESRIDKIQSMLQQSPNDCFLWHALGLEYSKQNMWQQSVDCYTKVLTIDTHYVGTYYHLAKTYERIQNFELAIQTYEKGIQIANEVKDMHARNELQMALDDLRDD